MSVGLPDRGHRLHQMVDTPTYGSPHKWGQHNGNIKCLTRQPVERLRFLALSLEGRGCLMSTYEEFMVILTVALLIVAILNLKHKK